MKSVIPMGILVCAGALAFTAQPSALFSHARCAPAQSQTAVAPPAAAPPQLHAGRHDFGITPAADRFERSFSGDGDKTWEPNFVASLTRVKS